MTEAKQQSGFAGIIKNLVIIFLVVTFVFAAGALVLRFSIISKLDRLSKQLDKSSQQTGFSKLLVDLSLAESRFQQTVSAGEAKDLESYTTKIRSIFRDLDSLTKSYLSNGTSYVSENDHQLSQALKQKLEVSGQLFTLQKRFDSLLRFTIIKAIQRKPELPVAPDQKFKTDTLVQTREESSQAGLIQRLKNAWQNKRAVKVMTIRERATQQKNMTQLTDGNLLDSLGRQYGMLSRSGQELTLANINLMGELRRLLLELQRIDLHTYEKQREATLREYQSATRELNIYTGIALSLVLVLIVLLGVYIRRASFAERRFTVANSRAVDLASQKSEILAIMSHEIRNKLMAINGAVYMIQKTELSVDQHKKIKSISLSSSFMLETVNNVLDISKLEQQPAELARHEFSPVEAISDSLEAMRFMAENKHIAISMDLQIATDKIVLGDSFRLKQVLINLLSNAIKYTDIGEVVVSGSLVPTEGKSVLTLMVKDTGPGIPKSKQAKLFSAYYQAGGTKPGTGLGLYLCRQLVQQQGGQISLESSEGQGCCVTVIIPFDQVVSQGLY